jgi:hypothetical protein
MPFDTGYLEEMPKTASGEKYPTTLVETHEITNGLVMGVFCDITAGKLVNITGGSTKFAGVVLRDQAGVADVNAGTYESPYTYADIAKKHYVTVQATTGLTPAYGDVIYVDLTVGNEGNATNLVASNILTPATFVSVIDASNDVWQISL